MSYAADVLGKKSLLKVLGKHKGGIDQCLDINKLGDVDLIVLEKILRGGLAEITTRWPVTPT